MARLNGWWEWSIALAATEISSISVIPSANTIVRATTGLPRVSVPVLSKTTTSTDAAASTFGPPLIRMPPRAALPIARVPAALYPSARYFDLTLDIPTLIALLVCLIPTTIGALLAAIGIAGMDRALMANIIAKSGKAVELAGDIDTLLLDKTGTITIGNRKATQFVALGGASQRQLARLAGLASMADTTPEGKSILDLARPRAALDGEVPAGSTFVEFTA